MVQDVNSNDFYQAFQDANRGNNFSYEGLDALYDWLEELSEDTGEEYHLDVIGLCSEFTEYENIQEFNDNYGKDCETLDDVSDFTAVIPIADTDRFIVQDF